MTDIAAQPPVADVRRDVVRISGPDATTFLHGQISQDVEGLAVGATKATFVLQPQGKVDVWGRITRRAVDEFEIDVDAGFGDALLSRLNRFKLRVDATLELLDSEQEAGPEPEAHEAERIAAGVPRMGREISPATIPAELGQWVIDESVSFTKGCFTGQELVARIDSRGGNVPRHLRVIEIAGDMTPPVGATLTVEGKDSGELTSVAVSASGHLVGLAFVPRAVEAPAPAELTWDAGHATAAILA
jgi:folate-binding protein YgfZ